MLCSRRFCHYLQLLPFVLLSSHFIVVRVMAGLEPFLELLGTNRVISFHMEHQSIYHRTTYAYIHASIYISGEFTRASLTICLFLDSKRKIGHGTNIAILG